MGWCGLRLGVGVARTMASSHSSPLSYPTPTPTPTQGHLHHGVVAELLDHPLHEVTHLGAAGGGRGGRGEGGEGEG